MSCKDCNWYSKEHRICVKTNKFEFENMPVCNDFMENKDIELKIRCKDCETIFEDDETVMSDICHYCGSDNTEHIK